MLPLTKELLVRSQYLGILCLLVGNTLGFTVTPHPRIPRLEPRNDTRFDSIKGWPLFRRRKTNDLFQGKSLKVSSVLSFFKNSKSESIESGVIETALVLANKQRRDKWTKEAKLAFWWIPPNILSTCIDGLAAAFCAVAPKDLKDALQPGGLDKVRSKIESDMVHNLKKQTIVQSLPLPKDDKTKLVEYLVNLSLDFFLEDLETTIAAPSVKLSILDRERRELLQYMTFREILWYRVKHKPKPTFLLGLLSLWTIGITVYVVQDNYSSILIGIQQVLSLSMNALQELLSSFFSFSTGVFFRGVSYVKGFFLQNAKTKISWRGL